MRQLIESALNENLTVRCNRCKTPCLETVYENEISRKTFPSNSSTTIFSNQLNVPSENVKQNYLIVNFYFNSMNTIIVEEAQAISFRSLAITIGWTVSLFLGSSFMTPIEIAYYLVLTIHEVLRKCFCPKSVRRTIKKNTSNRSKKIRSTIDVAKQQIAHCSRRNGKRGGFPNAYGFYQLESNQPGSSLDENVAYKRTMLE